MRGGPRIVVINAVGGIGTGKSGNGAQGKTLGSDTLIGTTPTCAYQQPVSLFTLENMTPTLFHSLTFPHCTQPFIHFLTYSSILFLSHNHDNYYHHNDNCYHHNDNGDM